MNLLDRTGDADPIDAAFIDAFPLDETVYPPGNALEHPANRQRIDDGSACRASAS